MRGLGDNTVDTSTHGQNFKKVNQKSILIQLVWVLVRNLLLFQAILTIAVPLTMVTTLINVPYGANLRRIYEACMDTE